MIEGRELCQHDVWRSRNVGDFSLSAGLLSLRKGSCSMMSIGILILGTFSE